MPPENEHGQNENEEVTPVVEGRDQTPVVEQTTDQNVDGQLNETRDTTETDPVADQLNENTGGGGGNPPTNTTNTTDTTSTNPTTENTDGLLGPAEETTPENPEPGTLTALEGDTFEAISLRLAGDATILLDALRELNPGMGGAIAAGTPVCIPAQSQIDEVKRGLELQQNPPPTDEVPIPESNVENVAEVTAEIEQVVEEVPPEVEVVDEVPPVVEVPPTEEVITPAPPVTVNPAAPTTTDLPYPVTTPTGLHNDSVTDPIPPVTDTTNAITTQVTQTATENPRSSSAAWDDRSLAFKFLAEPFVGPFFGGYRAEIGGKLSDSWKKLGTADNGWGHARDAMDMIYQCCDAVSKFTGPLATVLGIVSYIRYIPLPPVMAVGNALTAVTAFLKTLNMVLDIVKLVTGALRVVFGGIATACAKTPEARQRYVDDLKKDAVDLVADGFTVGFTAATGGYGDFASGFSTARQAGGNVLSSTWSGVRNSYSSAAGSVSKPFLEALTGSETRRRFFGSTAQFFALGEGQSMLQPLLVEGVVKPVGEYFIPPPPKTPAAPTQQSADPSAGGGLRLPLTTARGVARGGLGGTLRALQSSSRAALTQSIESSTTPITDNPAPPPRTTYAPAQLEGYKAEVEILEAFDKDLESQEKTAKAGATESDTWAQAATKHITEVNAGGTAVIGAKQGTQQDKTTLQQDKAEVERGKQESAKGSGAANSAGNGKPTAPGDASTDVPWYKKPFVWIIRKVNEAKQTAMDAVTNAIMEALKSVLGFDQLDETMGVADEQLNEQQQVLDAEPAQLDEVKSTLDQEVQGTTQAKATALEDKAFNDQLAAKVAQDRAAVQAHRQQMDAEKLAAENEKATYETTYAPAISEMTELAGKQSGGEVAPLRLDLSARIAIIEQMLAAVADAVGTRKNESQALVEALYGETVGNARVMFGASVESLAEASRMAQAVQSKVRGDVDAGGAQRSAFVESVRGRLAALAGAEPGNATLTALNDIEAEIVAFADAMDANEASELDAVHTSFSSAYDSMLNAPSAIAA